MGTAEINQRSTCGNEGSAMSQATAGARGEEASHPGEIPKRGWKEVLLRVKDQVSSDHWSIVSTGVAFFALLAIFPGRTRHTLWLGRLIPLGPACPHVVMSGAIRGPASARHRQ